MFMSSCKRLRIMKGSEARGLSCGVWYWYEDEDKNTTDEDEDKDKDKEKKMMSPLNKALVFGD